MKKIQLKIEDLFYLPTSVIYSPDDLKPVEYVTIDSRSVKKNSLFIAIKGKRFDGHEFIRDAARKGAAAVLIDEKTLKNYDDIDLPIITVKNTTRALGDIARIWRRKLSAIVIGTTGSTGKTTIKDMIASLLSERYNVSKTELNNNNHIGVPLTILNTNNTHGVLVAELGTNHFGEIPYTASILSPDYSLITNIGDSHLEFLKSRKGVWKEKSSLFEETINNGGKIFINNDDSFISKYKINHKNKITYGFQKPGDVKGRIKHYKDDGRPIIELKNKDGKHEFESPLYGEQNARNLVAAASVSFELGLTISDLRRGINKLTMPQGRLNVIHYKNFTLIDDTYNANPDSTKAAIDLVGKMKTYKRKILFLGDMLELGKNKIKFHEGLAKVIHQNKIMEVYTIGSVMKYLNKKITGRNITEKHFTERKSLLNFIRKIELDNSIILVKGSRRMKMEEFLEAIKMKAVN